MNIPNLWPNELLVHYLRLEDNFREAIITHVQKISKSGVDKLKSFLDGIIELYERKGTITRNSEFLFLAANAYQIQGKYDKVFEIVSLDDLHPGLFNIEAYTLISQRKFDEVKKIIEKANELSKHIDPYNFLLANANRLLLYYYSQDFDKIPNGIENFTHLYSELCDKYSTDDNLLMVITEAYALGKSILINLRRREGNLEEGATIGNELIYLIRKNQNRYLLNRLLNNTALCLIESGNLKDGLGYLEEHFKFSQILANEVQLAISANNIGFIFRNMGDIESAMKYFYIALENSKKANIAPYIVASETNIAHLHLDFGNPKLALSNSEIALESLNKSKVPIPPQIKIALDLCRADIYENLDQFNDADKILDEALIDINEANLTNESSKVFLRKARLSARQSNLGEASKFLQDALEIAHENNLLEIIVNAKLQLAEIDLLRYRMTNESILIANALRKIEDTRQLCIEQDYKLVLIDVFILQGLLLSMNNQQKDSKKVLDEAINLAKELSLPEKEHEARNQLKEIEIEKKSLLVRIFTRINQSIRSTISFESVTKPKMVEAEIKALYIISKKTGLPFYQKEFGDQKRIDPNLLSGLLSAIRTMGQTVLEAKEGGLKLIDHGDVSIMLETGTEGFIALVVSRETFLLREKLRELAFKLHQEEFFKKIDHSVVEINEYRDYQITKIIEEYLT